MSDRDFIHPLALAVLVGDSEREQHGMNVHPSWYGWDKHDRPLLTPRASRVMAAVEEDMSGMCADCPCESCEGCANAWMLADAVRAAWKETK